MRGYLGVELAVERRVDFVGVEVAGQVRQFGKGTTDFLSGELGDRPLSSPSTNRPMFARAVSGSIC